MNIPAARTACHEKPHCLQMHAFQTAASRASHAIAVFCVCLHCSAVSYVALTHAYMGSTGL